MGRGVSAPGLVEEKLGGAPYVVRIAGAVVPSDALGVVSIRRGRARTDLRPDAAQCRLVLATERIDFLPVAGDVVEVDLSADALTYLGLLGADPALERFRGRVTDNGARGTGAILGPARLELVAVGPRARAVRLEVGTLTYPAESDGARAVRILTEAAAVDGSLELGTSDAGTVTVQTRTGEASAAGTLFDRLAISAGGELVETRAGRLEWHDADHRRDPTTALTLRPEHVLTDSAEASQGVAGLLNDVTLTYGAVEAEVRVVDEVSADPATGFGPMAQRLETDLPDLAAAESRAFDLVGRYGTPRWRLERLGVELLRTVDAALAADLLALEFGDLLAVEGFPTTGPFTAARLFVEGGAETATRDAWTLAVAVSDWALSGGSARWADLGTPTAIRFRETRQRLERRWFFAGATGPTWAELAASEPDLTWLGAVGWDVDSAEVDRWLDQPSDTSWADTDPTTWAAFTGS